MLRRPSTHRTGPCLFVVRRSRARPEERPDHSVADVRQEMHRGFADTQPTMKFSHAEPSCRVGACRNIPGVPEWQESILLYKIQHMSVRLNITIDEQLYHRLKKELPPKGISAFIEDAVRARLFPGKRELDSAYKAAARERWRRRVSGDWAATDAEEWPE